MQFFFREIGFLAVLNSSKIDFWPCLKLQKKCNGKKKIREIDLFDFTSFFGQDFFKFSGLLWYYLQYLVFTQFLLF